MRLSAELLSKSTSFINTLNDRELDLRGNKIPFIENMGICNDGYDTIDLTDNILTILDNFPLMPRLKNFFVSNNQITEMNLANNLPGIEMLILNNNKITDLNLLLKELSRLKKLRHLSLIGNPICMEKDYRERVFDQITGLSTLDFRKKGKKRNGKLGKITK